MSPATSHLTPSHLTTVSIDAAGAGSGPGVAYTRVLIVDAGAVGARVLGPLGAPG